MSSQNFRKTIAAVIAGVCLFSISTSAIGQPGDGGSPRGPGSYATGFEAPFVVGALDGQEGWVATGQDHTTAITISNAAPNTGSQHVLLQFGTGFFQPKTAFSPALGELPDGSSETTVMVNISGLSGSDYYVFGNSASQTLLTWEVIFASDGTIIVYDPDLGFFDTGFTWVANTYKQLKVQVEEGNNQIKYYYDGTLIFTGPVFEGARVEQVGFLTTNFQFDPTVSARFDDLDLHGLDAPPVPGSCCYPDGTCAEFESSDLCIGGDFTANGTCTPNICSVRPLNDECANAIEVNVGVVTFDTTGATTDGPDESSCDFFGYSHIESDIWYCFTATCNAEATFSLCGSDYDTKIAVYDGCACPVAGAPLDCNEDFCAIQSQVSVPVTQGNTYLVRIGGYLGAMGPGTLTVSCTEPIGSCCADPCPRECLDGFTQAECAALDAQTPAEGDWLWTQNGVCGVSDVCFSEPGPRCCKADVNDDDLKDGRDIEAFLVEVFGGSCDTGAGPRVEFCASDMNYDLQVDENDVQPFVDAILLDEPCAP